MLRLQVLHARWATSSSLGDLELSLTYANAGSAVCRGWPAETQLAAGLVEEGLNTVEEALAYADETGERFYVGQLHRIRENSLQARD
jgi:hypothetical protein